MKPRKKKRSTKHKNKHKKTVKYAARPAKKTVLLIRATKRDLRNDVKRHCQQQGRPLPNTLRD